MARADTNGVYKDLKWLEEGTVLETLTETRYIDNFGEEVVGDLTVLKNGEDIGFGKSGSFFTGLVDEVDGFVIIRTSNGVEVARGSIDNIMGFDVLQMTIKTKGTTVTGRQSVTQTIKYMNDVWGQPVEGFLVNWKKVDGLSDNIDAFNEKYIKYILEGLDEDISKNKAYFDTFSGKMALENGFDKIHYINGVKNENGIFTSIEGLVTY